MKVTGFMKSSRGVTERLLQAAEPADSFKGGGGNDKRRQGLREHGRVSGLSKEKAAGALRQNETCPGSGQTDAAELSVFMSQRVMPR